MEKGGASMSDNEGESDAASRRLIEPSSENDKEDVRLLVQELRAARSRVHELQQAVATLEKDKRLANDRLALHSTLVKKLTRELVDERLAHIDTKKEVDELRRSAGNTAGSTGGDDVKSSQSPLQDREASSNPWTSPGKPVGSAATGGAGSVLSPPPGSKLMGFNFYSSEQQGEDEPPSPSSSTHTLRGTLMGQFLPSSLLDSPQMTPTHAKSFKSDNVGELSLLTEQKLPAESDSSGDELEDKRADEQTKSAMERLSLSSGSISSRRRSSLGDNQTDHHAADVTSASTSLETKQHSGTLGLSHAIGRRAVDSRLTRRASSVSMTGGGSAVVSPLKLSMLSELFDAIPVEELEAALVQFNSDEAAAIDHLVRTHPSFNPDSGAASGSSGLAASGASTEGSTSSATGAASFSAQASSTHGAAGHKPHRGSGSSGERQSGSGSASAGPGSTNWKTEICMYYMQGKCNKTRRTCSFAHGESDLVRPAAAAKTGYKTRLCPAYENGTCPKSRRDCPLAHGVNDLREPGASSQSTTAAAAAAAIAAAIPGGVNNPALLPPPTPRLQSYKTELCYYYLKGNCNYTKEECRFAHGPSDLRTVESNTIAQMNAAAAAAAAFTAGAAVAPGGVPAGSSASSGVPASFDKQLQWQHQYQPPPHLQHQQQHHQQQHQQQQMAHPPPGYVPHGFLPPSHQLQGHRGGGGGAGAGPGSGMAQSFGYQHPPPPPPQQSPHGGYHQQQHHMPSPHAQPFRYLKSMDDLSKRGGRGSASGRRDSGSSWSGYDPPNLPPPDF